MCKINTDGPLDAYPVLSRLVNEGRSGAFQPRCLRVEGQATMEELFDAQTSGEYVAKRAFTMGADALGLVDLDET